MVNIFEIPVYYIGFKKNLKLEENLKDVGFSRIHHFNSIDGQTLDKEELLRNGIISNRAYRDLVYGREQSDALSSLGTIGCTLSHSNLWKLCAENLPHIVIVEEDLYLPKLTDVDIKNIKNSLSKPNGAFISADVKKHQKKLWGLHFYILTNEAAKKLYNKAFPIEMQTDIYMGHLNNIGDIQLDGYHIGDARSTPFTTTTGKLCIKCILPNGLMFYICIIIILIILIIGIIYTKVELDSCRSSEGR